MSNMPTKINQSLNAVYNYASVYMTLLKVHGKNSKYHEIQLSTSVDDLYI